ncbi:MAG: serine/threonine-protein kinase PknD [Mycobacterium sp.]|uniref:serine/threonine-protein kinase PknD n=1 Tax=Mycobacterium sp. TaxID=1785 RepID=UPI003C55AC80
MEGSLHGTSFGRYRLLELLGRGGMGEVWRAHDTAIDRIVAIKILSAQISQDAVFQQRFRREAFAAARLNSPHVVPIHNHGEIDGRLYVDMRLIEGSDLQSALSRGPLPPERAVRIVEQIARALHAAHKVGLLHRDVKPSNVLLDDDDFAYLIDFGIARAIGERGLTMAGEVIGTFHYMAPERFTAAQHQAGQGGTPSVDARSDVYALACVLYECLTAEHPFPGDSLETQVTSHLTAPPPRPSISNPRLPGGFDGVIAKGMAKNPGDRYNTAIELAQAARDAVTTPIASAAPPVRTQPADVRGRLPGPPPHPSRPWWRRRKVLLASCAVVLTVAAVVAGIAVTTNHRSGQEASETTLPFSDLLQPEGVSVDNGGTVYVADTLHNRVLALSAGSTSPAVLPFDGLNYPTGVTADNSGTVYVTDAGNKRVVVLPAGSTKQIQLPFTDLGNPTGVTVDSSRTVYVTDTARNQVVALHANSDRQTALPFAGLNGPTGVVVNQNGTVYVADGGNNRVLALATGSSVPSPVPFIGLNDPGGVTVDHEGSVYVTNRRDNRVLKLPIGSTKQVQLPVTGIDYPWGLAVDNVGTVYVGGRNNKVVALRPS